MKRWSDVRGHVLWRDRRVLNWIFQGLLLLGVICLFWLLGHNLIMNYQRLNLRFNFDFLRYSASFDIGDRLIDFQSTDSYAKALWIGFLNSLRVMIIGIFLASGLGLTVGIARLSDNWLVRNLAMIFVEIFRNTPLLLQLFFWYFAVLLRLPKIDNSLRWGSHIFLNNRGLDVPWILWTRQSQLFLGIIVLSFGLIIFASWQYYDLRQRQAQPPWVWLGAIAALLCSLPVSLFQLDWTIPQFDAGTIVGGLNLSPEFATLLLGLTIHTAAFIAEVVRAGIQSVDRGQREAAQALGLHPSQMMGLIIFPQALRVIIPPLTSEYANLAKNSSLAIAIGYNDIYSIGITTAIQTGQSIEVLCLVMVCYGIFNLAISLVMNQINSWVQFKETK